MIAVVHQAPFLPWLGFFNKLAYSDRLVCLDNVVIQKRNWHNRTHIKLHEKKRWLTLPVKGEHQFLVSESTISEDYRLQQLYSVIYYAYGKTNYYSQYWPLLQSAIEDGYPNIFRINLNTIRVLLDILGLSGVEISLSSQFYDGDDRTERLIRSCMGVGATKLILGEGGSYEIHDLNRIANSGIEVVKQLFEGHEPVYPQLNGEFVKRLSVIDALFNIGAEQTLTLTKAAWRPNDNFLFG